MRIQSRNQKELDTLLTVTWPRGGDCRRESKVKKNTGRVRPRRMQGQDNMEEFFKTRGELPVVLHRRDA